MPGIIIMNNTTAVVVTLVAFKKIPSFAKLISKQTWLNTPNSNEVRENIPVSQQCGVGNKLLNVFHLSDYKYIPNATVMKALVRKGLRPHSFCYFSDILWSYLESLSFIFLVQFLEIATKQLSISYLNPSGEE